MVVEKKGYIEYLQKQEPSRKEVFKKTCTTDTVLGEISSNFYAIIKQYQFFLSNHKEFGSLLKQNLIS